MCKVEIVPYKHRHILHMIHQKMNEGNKDYFLNGPGKDLEIRGTAFTGMVDGVPQVCGAVETIWENRGVIWCVFNEEGKSNFVPVFRVIKKFLDESKFRRIEICIPHGTVVNAHRRAELLGFKLECADAKKYLPDGKDCAKKVKFGKMS